MTVILYTKDTIANIKTLAKQCLLPYMSNKEAVSSSMKGLHEYFQCDTNMNYGSIIKMDVINLDPIDLDFNMNDEEYSNEYYYEMFIFEMENTDEMSTTTRFELPFMYEKEYRENYEDSEMEPQSVQELITGNKINDIHMDELELSYIDQSKLKLIEWGLVDSYKLSKKQVKKILSEKH